MNDVCLVLLILLLIIVISRNSDIDKFETFKAEMKDDMKDEMDEKTEKSKDEVKETPKAPKKLKNSGENMPPKVQQVPNVEAPGADIPERIGGYEDGELFASYEEDYGDVVPLSMQSDYAILTEKNVLKPNLMANVKEERTPGFISDSQTPPFDPTAKAGLMAVGDYGESEKETKGSGEKSVEVHFVYAEWCGHSQNAIPAFEELTKMSDVKTQSGTPVSFVMTEEQSDGFGQFKGKVKGFPTYMTVMKENGEVKSIDELLVQSRSKEGILEATKELV